MPIEYADLVEEQREVADSDNDTVLVLGGAGTGKTTTALWAARRQLERSDQTPPKADRPRARVLFLTFSRTAVARVIERASGVVSGEVGRRIEVMTFHGFAYRLICDFGRYDGAGQDRPRIRSDAETKLLGSRPGDIEYVHLLPEALRLLRSPMIGRLLRNRWSLVVCDELQDTSDEQWELLELLGETARLVLLGDPNQMIYQWIPGVGPHRLEAARARPGCVEVTLPRSSHRDPSQVLPAAAEAILRGEYNHPDVLTAIAQDRMRIYAPIPTADGADQVINQIVILRTEKLRGIGVFVRENSFVEELCTRLSTAGVVHTPVGMSESYGQALRAQTAIMAACTGEADWESVCRELAVYLTSVTRGKVPAAARLLLRGRADSPTLQARLDALHAAIKNAEPDDLQAAALLAGSTWGSLGIVGGQRTWRLAAVAMRPVVAAARRSPRAGRTRGLLEEVETIRTAGILDTGDINAAIVQVMTVNQTKGREADGTILWGRSDDYYGPHGDWRTNGPRLIYVSLTRARTRVVLLLPPDPHPLLAPLLAHATMPKSRGTSG
jgi:DNA helicase II / ATP-dependent DNA helicase PcrA